MNAAYEQAVALVKRFEGCRLKAYQDQVGVWTVGYGETLGITAGVVWTQEKADSEVRRRVAQFYFGVLARCPQLWKEPDTRVAACVSLAYNIGLAGFGISQVRRATMRKDYPAAAKAFMSWKSGGGRILPGLVRRRKLEQGIYLSQQNDNQP